MKWFKQESNTFQSEKMTALRDDFGLEGYGIYIAIKEMIASKMDYTDRCSATHSLSIWKNHLGITPKKLLTILEFFAKNNIFSVNFTENSAKISKKTAKTVISISDYNLLKQKDEWSHKRSKIEHKTPELLRSNSGHKKENKNNIITNRGNRYKLNTGSVDNSDPPFEKKQDNPKQPPSERILEAMNSYRRRYGREDFGQQEIIPIKRALLRLTQDGMSEEDACSKLIQVVIYRGELCNRKPKELDWFNPDVVFGRQLGESLEKIPKPKSPEEFFVASTCELSPEEKQKAADSRDRCMQLVKPLLRRVTL